MDCPFKPRQVWGLVDPEKTTPHHLLGEPIYRLDFDGFLVGGTYRVYSDVLAEDVSALKDLGHTVGVFAVHDSQVVGDADFILATLFANSRVFGLRPFMDILDAAEERGLPAVPLVYIVRPGGTSISSLADPYPLPPMPSVLSRYVRLARRLGGAVYVEGGSGAGEPPDLDVLRSVAGIAAGVPVVSGGGIASAVDARAVFSAGADSIVIGTLLERGEKIAVKEILALRDKL